MTEKRTVEYDGNSYKVKSNSIEIPKLESLSRIEAMRAHYLSLAVRIRGALYAVLAVSLTLFLFVTFCLHVHGVM